MKTRPFAVRLNENERAKLELKAGLSGDSVGRFVRKKMLADDGTTPCADCGEPHGLCTGSWWKTNDALWETVVGDQTIVLCVSCFTVRARKVGITVHWEPVVDH